MKEKLSISVDVKNTGARSGKEVVQLYITGKVVSIKPAIKCLRGFEKIELKAGESKTVKFELEIEELAFVEKDNAWIVEPGDFEIKIGDQMAPFEHIK